jgi:transposase
VDCAEILFPHLKNVQFDQVRLKGQEVQITAHAAAFWAACPDCGMQSRRVHSRYVRRLSDTAVVGREVMVEVRVRRFVCHHEACTRKTFAEPLPDLATRYSRRTDWRQACWPRSLWRWAVDVLADRHADTLATWLAGYS